MKTYICDSCKKVIDDPHVMGMKEFRIGNILDDHGEIFAKRFTEKRKIHLCDECFHALNTIARKEEKHEQS